MHRIAVLNDYQIAARDMADWSTLERRADLQFFHEPFASMENAALRLRGFTVLCAMRERLPFPKEIFPLLPNLKCIVTTGSYNLAIDLEAARNAGVVVCATGNGHGQRATAELTWALILAATKHIPREDREIRAGNWQTTISTLLFGKTLGLIGLGGVGGMVAEMGKAFGMRVVAWSANLTEEKAARFGADLRGKDQLLSESDVVSLHVILSERTRKLIGRNELALMKPSAFLVNTSRGPILDEEALVWALDEGRIAGAAMDVFDFEPLPADHPYRAFPNRLILSPHIGYVAKEVYEVFYRDTVEAVTAFLNGASIRVIT